MCDALTVERLAAEDGVDASTLSHVLASLKADSDRDVRYFVERVTLSLMSSADCWRSATSALQHIYVSQLSLSPHTANCGRFCLWHCLWLFLCVWNISGTAERICAKFTRKTCLVPRSDECKGQGHQRQRTAFLALSAACVQFMFGKTSLASSLLQHSLSALLITFFGDGALVQRRCR